MDRNGCSIGTHILSYKPLGYIKLHCAPHLMHFAPSAALSGYPIYHLDVLAVI